MITMTNKGNTDFKYTPGLRIATLIILKMVNVFIQRSKSLDEKQTPINKMFTTFGY